MAAGLAGAVVMALGVTLTKRWGRPAGVSGTAFAGWQLTAGGLLLLPVTFLAEGAPPAVDGRAALGYSGRWVWTVMRGDPHVIPLLEEAIALLPAIDSPLRARLLARLAAGPLKGQGDASRARRSELVDKLAASYILQGAIDGLMASF